jgi:hypothetical protein
MRRQGEARLPFSPEGRREARLSVMVGLVPTIHVLTTSPPDIAIRRLARHQRRKTWMVATRATMTGKGVIRRVTAFDPLRASALRIRRAVLMKEATVRVCAHQVYIGADRDVLWMPRTNLKVEGILGRAIDHVMAIPRSFRKSGGVAGPEHGLTLIFDEDEFALQHIDKLVFVRMPMALA